MKEVAFVQRMCDERAGLETEELAKQGEKKANHRHPRSPGAPPVYSLHFGCQGFSPSILEGRRKQHWRWLLLPRRCAVLARLLKPSPGVSLQGLAAQDGGGACEESWVRAALLQPTGPACPDSVGTTVPAPSSPRSSTLRTAATLLP